MHATCLRRFEGTSLTKGPGATRAQASQLADECGFLGISSNMIALRIPYLTSMPARILAVIFETSYSTRTALHSASHTLRNYTL